MNVSNTGIKVNHSHYIAGKLQPNDNK